MHADLSDRLHNWARAHRWRPAPRHCDSAEGDYRPPRGNEAEYDNGLPPPVSHVSIDVLDAWAVELAWRRCSARARWCLKFHYHDRAEAPKACRLIRKRSGLVLRPSAWRDYMRDALDQLRNHLAI